MFCGLFFTALFSFVMPQNANAEYSEEWVVTYNVVEGDSYDLATDMAIDSEGNIIVIGYSAGIGTNEDYTTIKYDTYGNELWVARYNGPGNFLDRPLDMVLDSGGNVYVTGYSEGIGTDEDFATIKYDSDGNELWVARYNGPGHNQRNSDFASAITLDSAGNVYVTGKSWGGLDHEGGTEYDYATIKYDSNGTELWVTRYDGPGDSDDRASRIEADLFGNVYVTGVSESDFATIKYDTNGNQLWLATTYGAGGNGYHSTEIALDSSQNVYISGAAYYRYIPGQGAVTGFMTIKYDSNGNESWVTTYDAPGKGKTYLNDIILDSSRNVFVTGGTNSSMTSYDYTTIKYDSDGNELWVARYDGPSHGFDYASSLALDYYCNVYVTGWIYSEDTDHDIATIKYDSEGNELWAMSYNGPGNGMDYGSSIALDSYQNIYVTGFSYDHGSDQDITTIKYSTDQPSLNQPPVANAGSDQTVYKGDEVLFDGSRSYDPDTYWVTTQVAETGFVSSRSVNSENILGEYFSASNPKKTKKGDDIVSYEWDFGDGSPHVIGMKTKHIYNTPGVYIVTLTVADKHGALVSDTCMISVLPAEQPPVGYPVPGQNQPNEFVVIGGDDGVLYYFSSYGNGTFGLMNEIGNARDDGAVISYVDFANIAIADFDNDNDFDFVAGTGGGLKRIYLFTNDGNGNFNRTMIFDQPCYCVKFYQDFATADFDGDGYYDFVASGSPHGHIFVFINNQDQTFTLKSMIDETWFTGISAGIDTGDFNEDGKMDFLIADYGYDRETQQAHMYLGNGNGTFNLKKDAIVLSGIGAGGNGELWAITTGDFNNDGEIDAIVGQDDDFDPGQTYLYDGDGSGNFSYYGEAYDLYPSIESGKDLEGIGYIDAFDFDHDGNLDVVCADHGSTTQYTGKFWFVKGNGDGSFQTPKLIHNFCDFIPVMGISAPPYHLNGVMPPVAEAGPNQTVYEGDIVNFDGSGSIGGSGSGWDIQTVDSAGNVGSSTSIALDKSNNPHIAYQDYTNKNLKYAKWTGSTWNIETVDSSGEVSHYISIALDSNKDPHIGYYANGNLKYAKWTGTSWNIETVDSAVDAGWYNSIAIDSNDDPHISYNDHGNDDLKYAKMTGGVWSIETVDSAGNMGWYTSLALDSNNHPHISYTGDISLKYARWTGGTWNTEIVDPTHPAGGYTSIALDSSDNPHISYYDYAGYLKYVIWTGSMWKNETVDPEHPVGAFTSLALDNSDNPHISYYAWTNTGLKYAKWNGNAWLIETVDCSEDVGKWSSIALDGIGNPHISYRDSTNCDLKYAKKIGGGGKIISYQWDFDANVDSDGNGNPADEVDATGPKPTHIYGDDGVYTVTLTVMDDRGLSDTDTMTVTVNNVAPTIMSAKAYVFVNFTLRIAGEKWHNVEIYIYENGAEIGYAEVIRYPGSPDDQIVTIANVKCDVTKTITLTVLYTPDDDPVSGQPIGANPCWLNISFEDGSYELLHNTFKVNHPETWEWNIEFNQYLVGHEITFEAIADDLGSDDLTFTWNWGDGTPDTETAYYNDGLGSDPYPSPWGTYPFNVTDVKKHIYAGAGNYIVTLTVTDDDGGVDSDFATVTINNVVPIAHAGGPYFGNQGEGVTFTGTQTAPCTFGSFVYYWDFGDSRISNKKDPTHIYANYGIYTARLMVINEDGEFDLDICDVYVNANPIANAGPDQSVYEGDIVEFDGGESYDLDGSIISYEWDFDANVDMDNDGDYGNDADAIGSSVQHTYDVEGEYQVTLTVTDGFSTALTTLKVTVLPDAPPVEDEEQDLEEDSEENIEDIENEKDETSDVSEDLNEDIEKDIEPIVNDEVDLPDLPEETGDIIHDDLDDDRPVKPQTQPLENPKKDDKPNFPLHTITISISSIIISTLSLSLPLYMKINRKDLLKNRKRKLIYKYISTNPGDNFNGIKQALSLPNGVLTYHLKILEREDFVVSKRDGGFKRFYISGKSKMNNIKKLNGVQKDIFNTIRNFPGISQTEIAKKTGTTVQVVNYHIKRLQEDDLITLHMTNGHRSQCYLQNCENKALT